MKNNDFWYLLYLNENGNWNIDSRSKNINDLDMSALYMLYNGYTVKIVFDYKEE